MRLGGVAVSPATRAEFDDFCKLADDVGLAAIVAPRTLCEWSEEESFAFGEVAQSHGLAIGETGFWENLITTDESLRADRLRRLKKTLHNAEIMGCRSVAILTGTRDPSDKPFAAHPYMFTDACRVEVREIVLSALEGFEGGTTRLGIEPYAHSFFYRPEDAVEFIESVGHPAFGVHLDQANMVAQSDFFDTEPLIRRTFEMLKPYIVSVHLKDLAWPASPLGLSWKEVDLGEGAMALEALVKQIDALGDMCCFCEHYQTTEDYIRNFGKAHAIAERSGVAFTRRQN
jgi:sugar phosphate isomerase/epimerase